jgi:predicted nucleic acid-binding protein
MIQRYYFDTSIFGGFFDPEFSKETKQIFDLVFEGKILCIYSDLCEKELIQAPSRISKLVEKIPIEFKHKILVTPECLELAAHYIIHKVVGYTSLDDCIQIATATLYGVDALLSWNFKHIVNSDRITGYNHVNSAYGYVKIPIKSPREII